MTHTALLHSSPFLRAGCGRIRLGSRRRSAGYGAIAIMAVLGIVAATMMVTTLNASALRNDQDRKTGYALAQAKQALIARAASDASRPGSLPCPDVNNDGLVTMNVDYVGSACVSYVGRLPWKALGLPDLRDADGERLWYAVSPNFRELGTVVVNSATAGTINVTGNLAVNNAAAVVFAAGAPVDTQDRSGANVNAPAQYLDGANGATSTAFQSLNLGSTFNDRLMPVLAAELSSIVQKRVGKEIASALDAYYTAAGEMLPYPAKATNCTGDLSLCVSDNTILSGRIPAVPNGVSTSYASSAVGPDADNWFNRNGWRQLIDYTVSADCVSTPGCKSGGFTVNTNGGGVTGDTKVSLTLTAVNSSGGPVATTQTLQ